jgi:hypothetical protein
LPIWCSVVDGGCCDMDDGDVLCDIRENGATAKAIIIPEAIRDLRR